LAENGLRLRETARGSDDEEPMVECQFDQVHDQLAIVEHEGAMSLDRSARPAVCHGVPRNELDCE
jgi:hypothetical protein